jgi:speckle-type POZ protein
MFIELVPFQPVDPPPGRICPIGQQLGKIFSDKQLSDVKIECDGQTFDCHQIILAARSPVFMAMFQSNMKEKKTKTVTINDFKTEVVSEMLNYIYTGTVSSNDISEIEIDLLAAADKYQLDLLKNICEENLCSKLEVTNCVELFVVGDMHQTFKLRKKALRLAAENMNLIIDTDVFEDLFQQKPVLAWEVTKASYPQKK